MLSLIILLIVVGVLLYCVNVLIPMDPKIKKILNIVVVIIVVFWCLQAFGVFSYIANHDRAVPRVDGRR